MTWMELAAAVYAVEKIVGTILGTLLVLIALILMWKGR